MPEGGGWSTEHHQVGADFAGNLRDPFPRSSGGHFYPLLRRRQAIGRGEGLQVPGAGAVAEGQRVFVLRGDGVVLPVRGEVLDHMQQGDPCLQVCRQAGRLACGGGTVREEISDHQ